MINVLIVEDSSVARQHLKDILESDKAIHVMGMVENGAKAVEFIRHEKPDVITMDIFMPRMNGLEATRRIMETQPVPVVIVTASYDREDVKASFLALEAGAVAILEKPFGEGHREYTNTSKELIQTVKLMSEVKVVKRWTKDLLRESGGAAQEEIQKRATKTVKFVAIGASTGGPPVLQTILSGLPGNLPVPVLVVQHIAKGFLRGMIEWLGKTTLLPIHTAGHKELPLPGHIYFAPDDFQMGIDGDSLFTLSKAAPEHGIRPSVSYLFRSAMEVVGGNMVGVLLTGMGKDGANELRLMKEKGAVTIAQDKESSVIHGMPGEAIKLGAATYVLPPDKIAAMIGRLANRIFSN